MALARVPIRRIRRVKFGNRFNPGEGVVFVTVVQRRDLRRNLVLDGV